MIRLMRWLRILPLAKPIPERRNEDEDRHPPELHNEVWYTASAQKHYRWEHADAALRSTWSKPRKEPSKRTKGERAYVVEGYSGMLALEVRYEYASDGRKIVFHVNRKSGQRRLARSYRHRHKERRKWW